MTDPEADIRHPPNRDAVVDRIRTCLARTDPDALSACLEELHPSDLADAMEKLSPAHRLDLLRLIRADVAAAAVAEMEPDSRPEAAVAALPEADAAALLAAMADDDAADLLGALPGDDRERLLAALPAQRSTILNGLLLFPDGSSGGIMTTALVVLAPGLDAAEALAEVRRQGRAVDDSVLVLWVADRHRRLLGTLGLDTLVLADPARPIAELMGPPPATAGPHLDREEAARLLRHYDLPSLAVVDDGGRLLGQITWDDVMDVLEEEETEDLLRFSGTDPEEPVRGGWWHAVRSRLPWLFLNLATGSLAAGVVVLYREVIDSLVILAAVMPLVAGLGGNAGTQSLAVTIRRITLEAHAPPGRWRLAGKEALVGLTTGAALGLALGAVGMLWLGGPGLGLVVLVATWGNLVVASLAGAFVPVTLERLGIDPAVASSVFVTAFTDLAGFFLLLGLASALLL
ncbi:MAG TPA: magnesium transporter [Methylomirabilota bacterium]|nr:magnesium transporter [Methylomirabilota bacterium]